LLGLYPVFDANTLRLNGDPPIDSQPYLGIEDLVVKETISIQQVRKSHRFAPDFDENDQVTGSGILRLASRGGDARAGCAWLLTTGDFCGLA
jgi:hypothetical protein